MIVEVKTPVVGESIKEGLLVAWLKKDGDQVEVEEPLCEIETDKVTIEAPALVSGRLSIQVAADTVVAIGQTIATIDTDAVGAPSEAGEEAIVDGALETAAGGVAANSGVLSPAARRVVEEAGLDASAIPGTGKDGRVTKADAVGFGERRTAAPAETKASPPRVERPPDTDTPHPDTMQTRRTMSPLRARIAERLVEAQRTAVTLTTFAEADMSAVMRMRADRQEAFTERHGVKLGYMSFFIKAVVHALREVPELNTLIDGGQIVTNHFHHIGVAVSTDRGLVVPVVRDADTKAFGPIEREIADLARRARERKIELSDLMGGVFTITNGGVFGSMLSTPILNPPQSGILGMHTIKERPVAIDGEIAIRPMMNLALSYDHRIVDGREGVKFLKTVIEAIERPESIWQET